MKIFKKLTLISVLSTVAFQAQAVSFNDVAQFAQNNPKTTVAIAAVYGLGVKFNFERTGQEVTREKKTITNEPGIKGYSSLTVTKKEHSFIQTLGSFLFPFIYGIVAGN